MQYTAYIYIYIYIAVLYLVINEGSTVSKIYNEPANAAVDIPAANRFQ